MKAGLNELIKMIRGSNGDSGSYAYLDKPCDSDHADLPVSQEPVDDYPENPACNVDHGRLYVPDVRLGGKVYGLSFIAGYGLPALNKYHMLGITDKDNPLPPRYRGDSTYITFDDNESLKSLMPLLKETGLEVERSEFDRLCKDLQEDKTLKMQYTHFIIDY